MKKFLSVMLMAVLLALSCLPLAGCSSSLIDTVLADLPIAADIAISIVNIVSPGNAEYVQEVTEYASNVSADLKLLESIIRKYKNLIGAQPGAATVPATVLGQINALLNDVQSNLSAIMKAVNVSDPKITAAVAAAIASVTLILSDVALFIKNSTPPSVTALFFGLGMPGVGFLAIEQRQGPSGSSPSANTPRDDVRVGKPSQSDGSKGSGKSARQIAKEYNQKISKDFPKAKVNVPKLHLLGVPVPMTGK